MEGGVDTSPLVLARRLQQWTWTLEASFKVQKKMNHSRPLYFFALVRVSDGGKYLRRGLKPNAVSALY